MRLRIRRGGAGGGRGDDQLCAASVKRVLRNLRDARRDLDAVQVGATGKRARTDGSASIRDYGDGDRAGEESFRLDRRHAACNGIHIFADNCDRLLSGLAV